MKRFGRLVQCEVIEQLAEGGISYERNIYKRGVLGKEKVNKGKDITKKPGRRGSGHYLL